MSRRHMVVLLAVASGLAGEILAATSMTRIAGPVDVAGGRLGFPGGADGLDLRWTLFAVVSIAGWAGAVLWTSNRARDRKWGAPINVGAGVLAGIAIGLDHVVHADPALAWRLVAFFVGLAVPLFSSLMIHTIAHVASADTKLPDRPKRRERHQPATPVPPHNGIPMPSVNGTPVPLPAPTRAIRPVADGTQDLPAVEARRAFATRWLTEHLTSETQPNDLVTAAAREGLTITRQAAHKCLKRARDQVRA